MKRRKDPSVRNRIPSAAISMLLLSAISVPVLADRTLLVSDYVDKMKAGWIGQMAGVGGGAKTEFHCQGRIMPEDMVTPWTPDMINQFGQDDLYVEMTFLQAMDLHGLNVPIRLAGIFFGGSGYSLWHANAAGRDALRKGIAPPDSGHPKFNTHADDIDYQIEADYAGLIAPGLPQVAIQMGEVFGRLMNYGDGLYGGQFMGGMYSEAFFETDIEKIVRAGLQCIPEQSQYAECIRDVLRWHQENPTDWQKTWQLIEDKYQKNLDYRRASCDKGVFNIDAKINGAYVVMGLLYGDRDPDQTITISNRCGQDSDCNPSSSGGILFTTLGFSKLPEKFTSGLDLTGKFSHTPYDFPSLLAVCEKLARQAIAQSGGRVEQGAQNQEIFIIPSQQPHPSPLEQCWTPDPPANVLYTPDELEAMQNLKRLNQKPNYAPKQAFEAFEAFAPGWRMKDCGPDMTPGLYPELAGKSNVFLTHPLIQDTGCVLSRNAELPSGKKTTLNLMVGHHPDGDWDLIILADGQEILRKPIGKETAPDGWTEVHVDLSGYAGHSIQLDLVNQPTGWSWEAGYWAKIELVSD